MKLILQPHDVQLTPETRTHAEARIGRLDRHFDRIIEARAEFELESRRGVDPPKAVSLLVHLSGVTLKARAIGREWNSVLDQAVVKMDEQLRRRKERLVEHRAPPLDQLVEET
ncbi:MAG: putative sigma-54 modulation protein [Chloroflexota bacterium]|nr:putative sigma-54 modulation protein [Chloroflexota bacterium]